MDTILSRKKLLQHLIGHERRWLLMKWYMVGPVLRKLCLDRGLSNMQASNLTELSTSSLKQIEQETKDSIDSKLAMLPDKEQAYFRKTFFAYAGEYSLNDGMGGLKIVKKKKTRYECIAYISVEADLDKVDRLSI